MAAPTEAARQQRLVRLVWLSIGAALLTIALKTAAWALTGSVGLLSDAAESVVNLVAAVFALVVVHWAGRPPDEEHAYGHEKADYLSAGVEGALVLIAAVTIGFTAIDRLLNPAPIDDVGVGVAVSLAASVVNLTVARTLIRAGRDEGSLTLEADGRHLMTDVWTSVGVVAGVAAVALTDWQTLDPLIAIVVAANIVRTGASLVRRSTGGLMDRALEPHEHAAIDDVLRRHTSGGIQFHALRTRRAGRRAFVSVHVLVPGNWSVQRGHDLAESVEQDLRDALVHATVFTHLEPVEDPASFADTALDRSDAPPAQPPTR
jgi:cation diffusion facilitator family transporter